MEKVFLIDGHAQIFRMYYAYMRRPLINTKGEETSILFGFTKMLLELINRENPTHIAVAFDPPVKTFRHEAFPLYKANRTAAPEQVIAALEPLKEILAAFEIPVVMVPGFEADDVIGSMASQWADSSRREIYMVTPDKDYGQVVAENVFQYKPAKGDKEIEIIGPQQICEQYGIQSPEQVREILTIWGDASDNIPGAKGIGEVGARRLVGKYGTMENIYEHLEELTPKLRASLEEFREQMPMSRFLVTIRKDIQLPCSIDDITLKNPPLSAVEAIFNRYEFGSLRRLLKHCDASAIDLPDALPDAQAAAATIGAVPGGGSILGGGETPCAGRTSAPAFSFERAEIERVAESALASGEIALMPFNGGHILATRCSGAAAEGSARIAADVECGRRFIWALVGALPQVHQAHQAQQLPQVVLNLLSDDSVTKTGYNMKEYAKLALDSGMELRGRVRDLEIMHYILNPERTHKEDFLLRSYLNTSVEDLLQEWEKQQGMEPHKEVEAPVQQDLFAALEMGAPAAGAAAEGAPAEGMVIGGSEAIAGSAGQADGSALSERVVVRAAMESALQMPLGDSIGKELERNGQMGLYEGIEMPLIGVLAEMERNGVRIDTLQLRDYSKRLSEELAQIESQIAQLTGVEGVNLSSPKQVGVLLFETLGIAPHIKKNAKGGYPTDEETLSSLEESSPVVRLILEYRAVKKLLSTYTDNLPNLISPLDGKIHTTFNQALTATGRLSSNNPNLQNIPIRTERGREIRKAFVPSSPEGFIVSADYSQIELRLMAHLSGDPHFVEAFRSGEDIHTATAAKIFKVSPEEVTKEQRGRAKTANFGIIYGISAFGLSQRLGMSRKDSKELIDAYFTSYPGIKEYMNDTIARGREAGYVETIFGRKRFLPDINSRNANLRSFNERNAINAPLQGSAADIIKIAMVNLHRKMKELGLKSKLVLQVHDELVLDVVPEELQQICAVVKEQMESVIELKVPLIAECGYGKNWLEAH